MLPWEIYSLVILSISAATFAETLEHGTTDETVNAIPTTAPQSQSDDAGPADAQSSTSTTRKWTITGPIITHSMAVGRTEKSATGWETTNGLPEQTGQIKSNAFSESEGPPTVISIYTEINPSDRDELPTGEPPPSGGHTTRAGGAPGAPGVPGSPGEGTGGRGGSSGGDPGPGGPGGGPATAPPQPTGGQSLLDEIVRELGTPQPESRPTPGSPGQPSPTGGAAPTIVVDGSDPQTLTLTPGLSTTIGTGTTATLFSMTTNSDGYTVIIISSSGTVIFATATDPAVEARKGRRTTGSASMTFQPGQPANAPASSTGVAVRKETAKQGRWIGVLAAVGGLL